MKDLDKVRKDITNLASLLSPRESNYIRNLNFYMNSGAKRDDLWSPYISSNYNLMPAQQAEGTQTVINVGKSCVDAITSKISQANVRPFLNTINGDYDARALTKEAQQHFDVWLDEQHAYPKSVMCFRDAAVFNMGVIGVDPFTQSIDRVPPWEYFVDPAEYNIRAITRCMRLRRQFPIGGIITYTDNQKIKAKFDENPYQVADYTLYYDLYNGYMYQFYERDLIIEPQKLDYSQYGGLYRRPFVEMFYNRPLKSLNTPSLLDELYPIQRSIYEMLKRIDAATKKSGLQWVFVPRGSELKTSNFENGVNVYEYTPGPDGGMPTIMNPDPISNQYFNWLESLIEKAYQAAGISQLSAQSKKPSGLDSGKALETMEDIESDRFNTQLQQFTHFLVDLVRVSIDVFDGKSKILPNKIGRNKLTWGELRKQRDLFSIEFSAASALSKNPEKKLAQLKEMNQMGMINGARMAQLMEIPDLESEHNLITATETYCDRVIDLAVKKGEIDYLPIINLALLQEKAVIKLNQLEAANDDDKYIENLIELLKKVSMDIGILGKAANPAPEQAQPEVPEEPVAKKALDAGQINTLIMLAEKVQSGVLSSDRALAIAVASFPAINTESLSAIIGGEIGGMANVA